MIFVNSAQADRVTVEVKFKVGRFNIKYLLLAIFVLDSGVSMVPLILLLIGCLMAFGVTVLSVMLMMYRRRGTTSPVHIEPYMKQPIITPPDSRNNSMLDVTHGDHTYFVEYTLKQVTDYALNNQPDIIQSPQGKHFFLISVYNIIHK